VLKPKLCR